MFRIVLALLGTLACANVAEGSNCQEFLAPLGDSHAFQIKITEEPANDMLIAKNAIWQTFRPYCSKKDLDFKNETKCADVVPGNTLSRVCYLEIEHIGYFFVTRDMLDNINIIWNRWD